VKFGLKFKLINRLYFGKIPAKIPAKNKIPARTGTGTKSPNPGQDPGCTGIPVELCLGQMGFLPKVDLNSRTISLSIRWSTY
jgi:hypothetical protein